MKTAVLLLSSLLAFPLITSAEVANTALASTESANTDLSQFQQLLERQQYRKLQQQLKAQPDLATQPQLQLLQYKSMLSLGEDEALESVLEQQREKQPALAELFYLSAVNKFNLAQSGSMFSAPGRAKEGLALLKQAISMDPAEVKYQQTLISFYAAAPGIAGGDIDEAKKLADALYAKDPVQGLIAQAKVLQQDDVKKALQLLQNEVQKQPAAAELLQSYAGLLSQDKQHQQASSYYQKAAALFTETAAQYESLYQVGRLAALEGIDLSAGQQALSRYLEFYQGSDHNAYPWAILRLAQIQLRNKDEAAAKATVAPLLANEPSQKKLRNELKTFMKQLNQQKS